MIRLKNTKLFWDKRFRKYGKFSTGYIDGVIHKFDDKIRWYSFLRESRLKSGEVILDVGCNHGDWSIRLAKMGLKVTGIDIIKEAIEVAKLNAKEASVDIEFKSIKVEDINFAQNKFDKIISITVMQHILEDKFFLIALKKFQRQLKSKGKLVLIESAPNKTIVEKLNYKRERTLEKHLALFSQAGFKLETIRGINHLSVRWYYIIEHFNFPKKIKNLIQYIGLTLLHPIDIFLAKFSCLAKYSNLKLMIFVKNEGHI